MATASRTGTFASLQNPLFARYIGTFAISMVSLMVRSAAMGYLAFHLTGDPFKLGLMAFVQAAPEIILGPIAGAWLDRLDRRSLLIWLNLGMIACCAVLTLLIAMHLIAFWHLLVIGTVLGSIAAFDWPARLSLVPRLVERRHLTSAIALDAAAIDGSRVLGPSIAGLMLGTVGVAWCFAVSTILYIPFLLAVISLPSMAPPRENLTQSPLESLLDGYRYIWRMPIVRGLLLFQLVPITLGFSYVTMVPAFADRALGMPETGLGWLLSANGFGALIGTLTAARLADFPHRGRMVLVGLAALGAAIAIYGSSETLPTAMIAIAFCGGLFSLIGVSVNSMLQLQLDEIYRGRVTTAFSMIFGLTPIGGLAAGALANRYDVGTAIEIFGMLVLACAPIMAIVTPLRHAAMDPPESEIA